MSRQQPVAENRSAVHWDAEAEQALHKVPRFLRAFVRGRVEEFARRRGVSCITGEIVGEARRELGPGASRGQSTLPDPALVERLEQELAAQQTQRRQSRSYEVRVCAGAVGCPRTLVSVAEAADALAEEIEASGFPHFLTAGREGRPILSHHRFLAAVAGCPNACSQPQIADLGLIGRVELAVFPHLCTQCGECVRLCKESAIALDGDGPVVDSQCCVGCGDCARVCPSSALSLTAAGYRVIAGGKLGRHPRLAEQVMAEATLSEARGVLSRALKLLMREGEPGERLGALLARRADVGFHPTLCEGAQPADRQQQEVCDEA